MIHKSLMLAVAALVAAPAISNAQTEKPKDSGQTVKPAQVKGGTASKFFICTRKDLLGMEVRNPQGEKLGKLEDVVFVPDGSIAYGVLSFGGVLGLGDKLFAVPWSLIEQGREAGDKGLQSDKHYVVLAVDKDKLKNAPGFDKNNWPATPNDALFADVDKYYAGEKRPTVRATEASARMIADPTLRADKLKGKNVETPSGDKLGDIDEVVIDPQNGRIAYVVLSVGGFLGIGDRLVAVPWEAIKIERKDNKDRLTLAATKDKLEKAPQFDKGEAKWNEMSDSGYVSKVYGYWGAKPYWDSMLDTNPTEPKKQ